MAESPRIEELRRRVQADPASIAFAAHAEEYRRAARFDEAIETCRAGLAHHPSYVSARVTLGRALLEAGRVAEAREQLENVLRLAPENLSAIRGLAEIHARQDEDGPALRQNLRPPQSEAPQAPAERVPTATDPAIQRLGQFLTGISALKAERAGRR